MNWLILQWILRKVKDVRIKNCRIGEENLNKFNSKMVIVEYENARNIVVEFKNGNRVKTEYKHFKNGNVKNVYDRTVYSIGFIGEGKYKATENGITTNQYVTWKRMLERCYDSKIHSKYPTYIGCTVIEEWHNFQNFAKWYDNNYYEVGSERMSLDKDILIKSNKIYSPNTCVFVPKRINDLFINRKLHRGNLPIGVYYNKPNRKYRVQCNNENGDRVIVGNYDDYNDAFVAYKIYKENVIKRVAEIYKDKIPIKLYNSMIRYEVEAND